MTLLPEGRIAWKADVFGNAIATATFFEPTHQVEIVSSAEVDLRSLAGVRHRRIPARYPFVYEEEDWQNLGVMHST
ncbi:MULTISPECIES: hypothetical protein [unclassified Rhizobium]|uniref:hypothetical protein n=1 Tax=unclassified Rhizobium TaxID=2613769 RepID=UPI00386C3332